MSGFGAGWRRVWWPAASSFFSGNNRDVFRRCGHNVWRATEDEVQNRTTIPVDPLKLLCVLVRKLIGLWLAKNRVCIKSPWNRQWMIETIRKSRPPPIPSAKEVSLFAKPLTNVMFVV